MQIHGFVTAGMRNLHHVSFTALAPRKGHSANANRLYRSPNRRTVIRTQVRYVFSIGWNRVLKCEVTAAPNFSGERRNIFCRDLPSSV
jgi:hypothetical protein